MSGEHRLPACPFRQPAESSGERSHRKFLNGFNARRRQADDTTAGWAPRAFRSIAPQEIRLPAIRGSNLAKKMRKKVLTVFAAPD